MDPKNEQPQAVEEEVQAPITPEVPTDPQDDVITLSKSEFNKLNRKAFAYEATKKTPQSQTKDIDPEIVSRLSKIELIEAKRQFGFENQLSPEETDFVFKFSQGKPNKEILADPFVKSGLEGYRQSKRVSENTPGSSSRGFVQSSKGFAEMTDAERKQAFEEASKQRLGR